MSTELPSLNPIKEISTETIDCFRRDGHVHVKDIISAAELAEYRKVINLLVNRYNTEKRKLEEREAYGKAFLQTMNLWTLDDTVKKFVLAKRFANIAAALLGVENVRIYHDQALFKEPGGGPTPWHQDQYYWPVDTNQTITMWMPLTAINVEMGMLTFASGSHKNGVVFDYEISEESQEEFEKYIKNQGFPITRAILMQAGDATFHYGCTIHNAPGNLSDQMREVMTIIYIADGARITKPKHAWQENDHKTWLMGLHYGNLVNSELNPLII